MWISLFTLVTTVFSSYPERYYILSTKTCHQDGPPSLHGLWPQFGNGSWPSFCSRSSFDYHSLSPILPDLESVWYNCYNDSKISLDYNFWKHEWSKHGTCMFKPMTELDYFTLALNLYHKDITFCGSKYNSCHINLDINFNHIQQLNISPR